MTLPEKLILDFDAASVAAPETAAVITANRIIFEPDAVKAALLRHDVEESHEGEGVVWRYSSDETFEYLLLALDIQNVLAVESAGEQRSILNYDEALRCDTVSEMELGRLFASRPSVNLETGKNTPQAQPAAGV